LVKILSILNIIYLKWKFPKVNFITIKEKVVLILADKNKSHMKNTYDFYRSIVNLYYT